MLKNIILFICLVFVMSCKSDPASEFVDLELMSKGLPIKIKAPADPEIEFNDYGLIKDMTIKSGENYYVQILQADAIEYDATKIKEEQLNETKLNPFFSKLVLDEEFGFVYEKKIDSTRINYDFRFIKVQGDKEYLFQRGLGGTNTYTEEQVMAMYESVK